MSSAVTFPPIARGTPYPQLRAPVGSASGTPGRPAPGPQYTVATVSQSPLSPRNIVAAIDANNPELAKLRAAIDDRPLRDALAKPDISLSGIYINLGPELGARNRAAAAQRSLATAQFLSERDKQVKEALNLLVKGTMNNAQQAEQRALLKVYDKELSVLRAQRRDGIITDAPLLSLVAERNNVRANLTALRAEQNKITQDLATVMGVESAEIQNAGWPSLTRPQLRSPAKNDSIAERVRVEIERLPKLREYLTVNSGGKSPPLTAPADILAYYSRESGLENLVPLKNGGWVGRMPTHNLSSEQLRDITRRFDAPRQVLLLERVLVTRPNQRVLRQLAQAFPSLWAQAQTGTSTPAVSTVSGTMLASTSPTSLRIFTPPANPGGGSVNTALFARMLVEEAKRNPNAMAEIVRRFPVAVTSGGVASIRHLKPDELANVDQAVIQKRLNWLTENGKGGSPAAVGSAAILLAFAQLESVKRTGQGIKLGFDLKQLATALWPGGAPLAAADWLMKAFNPNLGRSKANKIAAAEAVLNLNQVILSSLAQGEQGLSKIQAAVKPITYRGTTHQRYLDLWSNAETAGRIHGVMRLDVLRGIYTEIQPRNDYNRKNVFAAERDKIKAYGEVSRAGLEAEAVLPQLLNVYGVTGQITSEKVLRYVESKFVFPSPAG